MPKGSFKNKQFPHSLKVLLALRAAWPELPTSGRLLLAVSGGLDSMCLLEAAVLVAGENLQKSRLGVVHVNHSLRGKESDADEAFVAARAKELGLPFLSFRLRWGKESPSQDACRKKRDAIFADLCGDSGDRVLLGHHLNDQAETVLLRLMRGTGARGLKGMLPHSGFKVRPFLRLEKSELLAAAKERGWKWREDSSNLSLDYDRNWLRSLFPLIEERRPGFPAKLASLAEEAQGWKFSEGTLDTFSPEEGISFSRPRNAVGSLLQQTFRLNRAHTKDLLELLAKSSGQTEAEGVKFYWSAGILLAERGRSFQPSLDFGKNGGLSSELGHWTLPQKIDLSSAGGEKAKKEFQSLRVPIFFRPGVPMISGPVALLPPRHEKLGGDFTFTPSALSRWWLGL